jgi:DNA-binding beta-propeller fold protein YncE
MKGTIPTVLLVTAALGAGTLRAAPTPANALLVLEKAQNSLVIVDPVNLQIAARVPAGENPHEVAVADDGLIAYISNYSGNTIRAWIWRDRRRCRPWIWAHCGSRMDWNL